MPAWPLTGSRLRRRVVSHRTGPGRRKGSRSRCRAAAPRQRSIPLCPNIRGRGRTRARRCGRRGARCLECRLAIERTRCSTGLRLAEEVLRIPSPCRNRAWACGPVYRPIAILRGRDRHLARKNSALTKRFRVNRRHMSRHRTLAELSGRHGRNTLADPRVRQRPLHIRDSAPTPVGTERRNSASVANVCDVRNVRNVPHVLDVLAVPASPVPGEEAIARSDRQPTHVPESKADPEVAAAAKAEERDISGCPNWPVDRVAITNRDRPGPPGP
jgi:hypothetical protein